MLSLLDNVLVQALTYAIAVAGVFIAFRVARYPDLTADGSFLLGSCSFVALINVGITWTVALIAAASAGAAAGLATSLMNSRLRISKLLTGILTSMASYSICIRILGHRANMGVSDHANPFVIVRLMDARPGVIPSSIHWHELLATGFIGVIFMGAAFVLLRSDLGIAMRANGENPTRMEDLGRSSEFYMAVSLSVANALVAVCGAVLAARQSFVDVGTGFGVILGLVAALVIGEELARRVPILAAGLFRRFVAVVLFGSVGYFVLYLTVLRLSIRGILPISIGPTDLKLLSSLAIIMIMGLNRKRLLAGEEVLPL